MKKTFVILIQGFRVPGFRGFRVPLLKFPGSLLPRFPASPLFIERG
jgi:hypothetical protein